VLPAISIKELLEAGAHFGHQTKKWNPKVKPYLFGERNGIYIIDLQKTVTLFKDACEFAAALGEQGKTLLFVGTKRQAQEAVREEAERSGNFYVNQRWLGGLITNWETVRRSVETLKKLEETIAGNGASDLSKKDLARLEKKRTKLAKVFSGIKEMKKPPDALFVIDPKRERIAVSEANRRGIKVIAVVDTNCDPEGIDFVIPGNDDAIRSIRLFAARVSDSFLEGAQAYEARRAERQAAARQGEEGAAAGEGAEAAAPKEPPRKRITLTVPPGGQAPKPSGPGSVAPVVHAEGTIKAN
jgi:small subunit ribosomal protein S2